MYNTSMNKIFLFAVIVLLFQGCSFKTQEYSAQKQLDYYGTYTGVLPCNGCMGIRITLRLSPPDVYEKTMRRLETDNERFYAKGNFFWDEGGNVIILDDNSRYRVKKDALILPDSGRKLKMFSLSRFVDHNGSY